MPALHDLIDLKRYPLTSLTTAAGRAFLQTVRCELEIHGCAVLPGFLKPSALAAGIAECRRARAAGMVFSRARDHNVYMSPADDSLPTGHPVHRLQTRTQGYIAYDQLEHSSIFRALYLSEPLTDFVCAATQRDLYRSADPIACAPISVMEAGQCFPWHFDENDVTLTLMLQAASEGGTFEFYPRLRSEADENIDRVSKILDDDLDGVVSSPLEPGDLQLFHGQNALHRVTHVAEDATEPRFLWAPAWNDRPGLVNTVARSTTSYGRALEVHHQREEIAGREGLRGRRAFL